MSLFGKYTKICAIVIIGFFIGRFGVSLFFGLFPIKHSATADFDVIWNIIVNKSVDEVPNTEEEKNKCFQKILGCIPQCIDDSYAAYLSLDAHKKLTAENDGRYKGVGLKMVEHNGNVIVVETIAGSPAARSMSFQAGDIIEEVNGKNVSRMSADLIASQIYGMADENVTIRVRRNGALQEPVTLKRSIVEVRSVEVFPINGSIGYLKVSSFLKKTHIDFLEGIAILYFVNNLDISNIKIIIDLRNNPGGSLFSVEALGLLFAQSDDDTFLTLKGRSEETFRLTVRDILNEPLNLFSSSVGLLKKASIVVLVNSTSASASEIFAALLRDWHSVPIVGEKTFGKGSIQRVLPIESGGAIKLTTGEYFVGNGKVKVDGIGLIPDFEVVDTRPKKGDLSIPNGPLVDLENDEQLKKAIEILSDAK